MGVHGRAKQLLFANIRVLRDPHGAPRKVLRNLRVKIDAVGLWVLRKLALLLLPFRDKPVALMPYAEFEGDGFATQHHVEFLQDTKFTTAFDLAFEGVPKWMDSENYRKIIWRAHICVWGANHALNLKGDFVELGVWYGLLPKTVCEIFREDPRFLARQYFLVDTWGLASGSHPNPDYHADIYTDVQKRFADYPNVTLVRGAVPDILSRVSGKSTGLSDSDSRIAFLTIDMNGHLAERASLEYYYDKLVPGAFVYFDDYGWGYQGLAETVNEFLRDKPETLLHFPSGQSIFLKK